MTMLDYTSPDDPIAGSAIELVDQPLLYQHCRIAMPQAPAMCWASSSGPR